MDISDRVALVPGAIRGIGLSIAIGLAQKGVKLVLPYYDWLDELEGMKESLDEVHADYIAMPADLTKEEDVQRVVGRAREHFGRLDILINNIERGGWPLVHGPYVPEQWDLEFKTTVNAKHFLFNHALPLLKSSDEGAVVNITSIAGEIGRSGPVGLIFNDCYSLSNRGVSLMTQTWAREAAPTVRVNELMLGIIETRHGPGTRGWKLMSDDQKQAILEHTLLRRTGFLEEVARAVLFLVEDATFMTGSIIKMDGGYMLGGDAVPPMPEGVVKPGEPTFGGTKPPMTS